MLKDLLIRMGAALPLRRLVVAIGGQYVPIFMMHRFSDPERGVEGHDLRQLESFLSYIRAKRYNPVALDQVFLAMRGEARLPAKPVVFTVDDGFYDHATIGLPLFLKYDFPVTCFLITGFLDGELWAWDDQVQYLCENGVPVGQGSVGQDRDSLVLAGQRFEVAGGPAQLKLQASPIRDWMKTLPSDQFAQVLTQLQEQLQLAIPEQPPERFAPMSWQQARDLEKSGASFAAHTHSHRILSSLSDAEAEYELSHSCQRVAAELQQPGKVFCYPTGRAQDFGPREERLLQQLGFIGAVATTPGTCSLSPSIFSANRLAWPDQYADFLQYLSWMERGKELLRG